MKCLAVMFSEEVIDLANVDCIHQQADATLLCIRQQFRDNIAGGLVAVDPFQPTNQGRESSRSRSCFWKPAKVLISSRHAAAPCSFFHAGSFDNTISGPTDCQRQFCTRSQI